MMITLEQVEKFAPTDWQGEDVSFLSTREWSANWSQMGCYKTSTGLWLIEQRVDVRDAPKVLIITTKSGKGAFFHAIPRCLDMEDWHVFNVMAKGVEELMLPSDYRKEVDLDDFVAQLRNPDKGTFVIAHFHSFMNPREGTSIPWTELFDPIEWQFILVDEGHRMKNRKAQWTKNIKRIALDSWNRHVMTGTGFVNDPSEIWSLLNFLSPITYRSYWRFRRNFCVEENWTGFNKVVGLNPHTADDFRQMRKQLGPRRTMAEVHPNIAEPIYTDIDIELNPTQRRMYSEILAQLRMLDQNGAPIFSPNVLSLLSRLRQISVATPEFVEEYYDEKLERRVQVIKLVEPSAKLDALTEILEGLQWDEENKQQAVVFSNFTGPLHLAAKRLDKAKIPYIHMEQKDSENTRYEKWGQLFPSKEHRVFLSTIDLGGESISLSSAQYCIFLDRSWSPAKNAQAVSRVWRPGQKGVAEVIHINAIKTVDKRVLELNNMKDEWFQEIFNDD